MRIAYPLLAVKHATLRKDVTQVGPRTNIAGRDLRVGDLVLVDDPHIPREFLATVTGAYTLEGRWYLGLGPAPGSDKPVARQSTKLRCVREAWRRSNRK